MPGTGYLEHSAAGRPRQPVMRVRAAERRRGPRSRWRREGKKVELAFERSRPWRIRQRGAEHQRSQHEQESQRQAATRRHQAPLADRFEAAQWDPVHVYRRTAYRRSLARIPRTLDIAARSRRKIDAHEHGPPCVSAPVAVVVCKTRGDSAVQLGGKPPPPQRKGRQRKEAAPTGRQEAQRSRRKGGERARCQHDGSQVGNILSHQCADEALIVRTRAGPAVVSRGNAIG